MKDDLDPARGLAFGCVIGSMIWVGVFLVAWFVLPGPW